MPVTLPTCADFTMEALANSVFGRLVFDAQDMIREIAPGGPRARGVFEREDEEGHGPYEESVPLSHFRHLYSIDEDSAAGHHSTRTLAIVAIDIQGVAQCPGDGLRDAI